MHRLAGAVDAALGREEGVELARRRPSVDAAIGQVEGGLLQIEEGVIALLGFRDQQLRRHAARAARKARLEADIAVRIGPGFAEHLVIGRDEADLDPGESLGAVQRAHDGVDAVGAAECRQAEIRHDEPLRGEVAVIAGVVGLRPRGDDIDAGFDRLQRVADRDRRRHRLIELRGHLDLAGPDLLAGLAGDLVGRIAVELAQESAIADRDRHRAVADAVDGGGDAVGVDRVDRDRRALAGGQDIGIAGEARPRVAVANIAGDLGRLRQRLAIGGGQAGADAHRIAVAMLQSACADLVVLGLDGEAAAAFDDDEIGKLRIGDRQRIGEHDAHARRFGIGIDAVRDDAEAVLAHRRVERGADRLVLAQRQREAIGADGLAPHLPLLERAPEKAERQHLVAGARGAEIGVDRRRRGGLRRLHPLAGILGILAEEGGGEIAPDGRIVGEDGEHRAIGARGGDRVTADRRRGGALGDRGIAEAIGGIGGGEPAELRLGLVERSRSEEGEFVRALGGEALRHRLHGDDAAGDGIHSGAEGAEVILEEAPARLGVVGEGAAALVGDAGRGAGGDIDILQRLIVEPGIVGVLGRDDAAVGRRGGLARCEAARGQERQSHDPQNALQTDHRLLPSKVASLKRRPQSTSGDAPGQSAGARSTTCPSLCPDSRFTHCRKRL